MSVVVKRYRPNQFREADLMIARHRPVSAAPAAAKATKSAKASTPTKKTSPPAK